VKGYYLSEQNPSLDPLNPFRLIGRVEKNLDDFVILLEPGEAQRNSASQRTHNQPLRSAPAK
jgi:hypothetical protein